MERPLGKGVFVAVADGVERGGERADRLTQRAAGLGGLS